MAYSKDEFVKAGQMSLEALSKLIYLIDKGKAVPTFEEHKDRIMERMKAGDPEELYYAFTAALEDVNDGLGSQVRETTKVIREALDTLSPLILKKKTEND